MSFLFKHSIKGDKVIWMIILCLTLISILAVYSSTYNLAIREGHGVFYYLFRHSFYVGLGLFLMYWFHTIPVGYYKKLATMGMLFGVALLVCVFIFPDDLNKARGAHRWTEIPLLGISLQSSDAAKIALVVYLAMILEKGGFESFGEFFLKVLAPIGVVVALVLYGNMSTAGLIGITSLVIILISDVKWSYIAITFIMVGIGIAGVFYVGKNHPEILPRFSTAINRTERFSDNERDAKAKAKDFQPQQAMIAVASGGVLGKGPGNSKQQYILSEAYNDFIYAIIVEEYGLVGGIVVLMMYLWLFYRVVMIAKKCTRKFPIYVIAGLVILIVLQAMVHMAVSVGALPVMGQTLPLVSLGGTSILFMSIAFGIILAVSRAAERNDGQFQDQKDEQGTIEELPTTVDEQEQVAAVSK